MANDTFHPFPRLPFELRLEIWRLCLPHRVSEMDFPVRWMIYDPDLEKFPCEIEPTSFENGRPPLLTRVCRESRSVAFESGNMSQVFWSRNIPRRSRAEEWYGGSSRSGNCWQDTVRDSVHSNWTSGYGADLDWDEDGHQLSSIVWEANVLNGSASIMLDYLEEYSFHREEQKDIVALKLLPKWRVVVNVIVVHLDFARAVKTGFFGLLGEEPVQVLDATSPLVSQLYDLAESCERNALAITSAQDFTRMSTDDMDAEVKRRVLRTYGDPELAKRMRPAVMFRLCTKMCNHSNTLGEHQKV